MANLIKESFESRIEGTVGLQRYFNILPSSNGKEDEIRNFHW